MEFSFDGPLLEDNTNISAVFVSHTNGAYSNGLNDKTSVDATSSVVKRNRSVNDIGEGCREDDEEFDEGAGMETESSMHSFENAHFTSSSPFSFSSSSSSSSSSAAAARRRGKGGDGGGDIISTSTASIDNRIVSLASLDNDHNNNDDNDNDSNDDGDNKHRDHDGDGDGDGGGVAGVRSRKVHGAVPHDLGALSIIILRILYTYHYTYHHLHTCVHKYIYTYMNRLSI